MVSCFPVRSAPALSPFVLNATVVLRQWLLLVVGVLVVVLSVADFQGGQQAFTAQQAVLAKANQAAGGRVLAFKPSAAVVRAPQQQPQQPEALVLPQALQP
jgi:hypothetical protein